MSFGKKVSNRLNLLLDHTEENKLRPADVTLYLAIFTIIDFILEIIYKLTLQPIGAETVLTDYIVLNIGYYVVLYLRNILILGVLSGVRIIYQYGYRKERHISYVASMDIYLFILVSLVMKIIRYF